MNLSTLFAGPSLLIALIAGAAIGSAHYLLLWRNIEVLVAGGAIARALILHLGRLLITGTALYCVARFGALPLGAALLGIIGARIVIGRRLGGAS